MATRIVPPSTAPLEERIQREVPYSLWYCPAFPLARIGGKLDKDPDEHPWLQGLYEDLQDSGIFRNPLIVWNHHPKRGTKQPEWLIRAGSNRLWCAEQLGWEVVPVVCSTEWPETPLCPNKRIQPREIEHYFKDPGVIWANDHGFGLLAAHKPESMYARFAKNTNPNLRKTGDHGGRRKMYAPHLDKE